MNPGTTKTGKLIATVGVVLLLAGCILGPDYKRPVVESPEKYRFAPAEAEALVNLT